MLSLRFCLPGKKFSLVHPAELCIFQKEIHFKYSITFLLSQNNSWSPLFSLWKWPRACMLSSKPISLTHLLAPAHLVAVLRSPHSSERILLVHLLTVVTVLADVGAPSFLIPLAHSSSCKPHLSLNRAYSLQLPYWYSSCIPTILRS